MRYLSRISVDYKTVAQCRLQDSYAWHRALWKSFHDIDKRNFLFRVEPKEEHCRIYLLSVKKPNPLTWKLWEWEVKAISESFLNHSTYHFQLCANPTIKQKQSGRKNGIRIPICGKQELSEWLERKANSGGISVDTDFLQISPPVNQPFYKNRIRGNHKRVDFQGVLNVEDREKFKESFNQGIGSAKAFGFGMLVLQPIITKEEII